jgi:prepilin-type N-terminal cleavage/methylation domain-containing protein
VKRAGEEPKTAGFTLIEVIAVIVIAGILAAATASGVSRVSSLKEEAALNAVVAHARYLQGLALARNLRTWMAFDVGGNSLRGYVEDPDHPGSANRLAAQDPISHKDLVVDLNDGFGGGIRLSTVSFDGGSEISFDGFGSPFDVTGGALDAEGTVTFANGSTISVSPGTGYVSIR